LRIFYILLYETNIKNIKEIIKMKKILVSTVTGIAVLAIVTSVSFGVYKDTETYKHYARLDALGFYVQKTYGTNCMLDYNNAVMKNGYYSFDVLDSEGNVIAEVEHDFNK
jgi:hypothetical protein